MHMWHDIELLVDPMRKNVELYMIIFENLKLYHKLRT